MSKSAYFNKEALDAKVSRRRDIDPIKTVYR